MSGFALVVEDSTDLRDLFRRLLEEAGFEVVTTYSVATALQALEDKVPDVITLDLNLPGGSGREVLQVVRATPRLAQTRVIIVTAYPDEADDLYDEADLVLAKPVGYKQLQDLVLRLAGWKRTG